MLFNKSSKSLKNIFLSNLAILGALTAININSMPVKAASLSTQTTFNNLLGFLPNPKNPSPLSVIGTLIAHPPEISTKTVEVDPLLAVIGNGAVANFSIVNLGDEEIHGTIGSATARGSYVRQANVLTAQLDVSANVFPGQSDPPLNVAVIALGFFEGIIDFDFDTGVELVLKKGTSLPLSSTLSNETDKLKLSELFSPVFEDTVLSEEKIIFYDIEISVTSDSQNPELFSIVPTVHLGTSNSFLNINYNQSVETITQKIISAFNSEGIVENDTLILSADLSFADGVSGLSFEKSGSNADNGVEVERTPEPSSLLAFLILGNLGLLQLRTVKRI